MNKQIIISISREYGSGGHEIAEQLAKTMNLPLYDKNLLNHVAEKFNSTAEELEKYEEKPRNRLFTRTVKGHTNSMEENLAQMQFDYLKSIAEEGKSFVVVGRCSESVLEDYAGLISIFIVGDAEAKIKRIMDKYELSRNEAAAKIERHDRRRKAYHNYYSKHKWGDSRAYDLCINSSGLGRDAAVSVLERYIEERIKWIEGTESGTD